jgi:hypothetical protein
LPALSLGKPPLPTIAAPNPFLKPPSEKLEFTKLSLNPIAAPTLNLPALKLEVPNKEEEKKVEELKIEEVKAGELLLSKESSFVSEKIGSTPSSKGRNEQ